MYINTIGNDVPVSSLNDRLLQQISLWVAMYVCSVTQLCLTLQPHEL